MTLSPSTSLAPSLSLAPSSQPSSGSSGGGGGSGGESGGTGGGSGEQSFISVEHEKGRVRIEILGALGGFVTVTRGHPSGKSITVRSMELVPLSGGAFLGYDYESPIGVPVTYQATYLSGPNTVVGVSNTATIQWDTNLEWLKDPLEPVRNMPIMVQDMSTLTYQTPTGVFPVLGRPEPITVSEVRQAATGDVTFATGSMNESLAFKSLTASGHVLLLQSSQRSSVGSMYIAPLNIVENRNVWLRDEESRAWVMTYQEVRPPVGDAQGALSSYADLLAQFHDYQDIRDAGFPTYIALIESIAGKAFVDTLPWRGA